LRLLPIKKGDFSGIFLVRNIHIIYIFSDLYCHFIVTPYSRKSTKFKSIYTVVDLPRKRRIVEKMKIARLSQFLYM
ncbi:MAG: hypothetical protein LUD81_03480, partial [Clostridiales bacterium]|nr:hypothetical protein [Clostridiales bacterium]